MANHTSASTIKQWGFSLGQGGVQHCKSFAQGLFVRTSVCVRCFSECACPGGTGGAVMGVGWKRAVGWVYPSLALCHKWFLIRCIIACGCELSLPSAVSNRWKIKRTSTQAIFGIRFVLIQWRRTSEAINTPKRRGCERKMERLDGWIHSELGVLPARPTDQSCSFALQRFELLFKGSPKNKKIYFSITLFYFSILFSHPQPISQQNWKKFFFFWSDKQTVPLQTHTIMWQFSAPWTKKTAITAVHSYVKWHFNVGGATDTAEQYNTVWTFL